MTLATASRDGLPWASPVYFTPDGYTDVYWVSSPEARHSRNIAERPEVGIVMFDSTVPIGSAQAVYLSAVAALVPGDELERCSHLYSARFPELKHFPPDQLRPPALPPALPGAGDRALGAGPRQRPRLGAGVDSRVTVDLGEPG